MRLSVSSASTDLFCGAIVGITKVLPWKGKKVYTIENLQPCAHAKIVDPGSANEGTLGLSC